jgi:undecaprenyl-diphosphatase
MLSPDQLTDTNPDTTMSVQMEDRREFPPSGVFHDADVDFLLWLNQLSRREPVAVFFRIISRLGDGVFWYSLMAVMLFQQMYLPALHMVVVALTGLIVYRLVKSKTKRPRPYVDNPRVILQARPLDQYSFPSGHTLHAVSLTLVSLYYYPVLGMFLVPFALLIMLSRCVLGLHYPSDVMVGASAGLIIASLSFVLTGML